MADSNEIAETIIRVQKGLAGFASDMRRQNIHVGLGALPYCVACGEAWPCEASRSDRGEVQ
jgi:hypothetical protein